MFLLFRKMLLVESDLLLQILLDNRVLFPTPLCRQVFVCDHHFPFPHVGRLCVELCALKFQCCLPAVAFFELLVL